jgi:asparagine synthase (glutamine-hydrolysing)
MCGIAGLYRFDPAARVEPALVGAMGARLAHRGPDEEGVFVGENVGLAHRRLSIIDLAAGHQPLFNEDQSVVVVFNGEIYNHRDLRTTLQARGHRFATRSDTEVILHGYEERGEDSVSDLRGMFAFALWDRRRRRLVLARDRVGIKPLYYYQGPDFLAFASEIKALLVCPGVPRELDSEALDLYLSLRYVPGPRTLFKGIRKLEPGHLLVRDGYGSWSKRYWDLPLPSPGPHDAAAAARRFEETLEESVRLHLMSEVPLGVFLSGGLDSTAVLALLTRVARGERLKTFTVGYEPSTADAVEANEFDYARLAAESFGAEHQEIRLGDEQFQDTLADVVWHLDEPVADPACVPLFHVSRLARSEITVVLSGEGADEILGGYPIYRRMLGIERAQRWAGSPLAALAPLAARSAAQPRLRQFLRSTGLPLERRYRGVSRAFLPETKATLLGRAAPDDLLDDIFGRRYAAVQSASALERMLYVDTKIWLPDDLLVKADKMTMANSQELRVPFLDHHVVELAAAAPSALKVNGSGSKLLLRQAMNGIVPRAIIERSKKGFPVPTVPLLQRLGGFTRELLLGRDSACRSRFDAGVVARLLDEHERGKARWDQELWSLLVFELWHGIFLDRRIEPGAEAANRRAAPPARVEVEPYATAERECVGL